VYYYALILDIFYAHCMFAVILILIAALYLYREVLVLYLYIIVLFAAIIDAAELE
jgi:hypothetical protein